MGTPHRQTRALQRACESVGGDGVWKPWLEGNASDAADRTSRSPEEAFSGTRLEQEHTAGVSESQG